MNIFQRLYHDDLKKAYADFGGMVLDNIISDTPDIQSYLENLKRKKTAKRILVSYHNHLWEPVLSLASNMGLRKRVGIQNWLDDFDVNNILNLAGYRVTNTQKRFFGLTNIIIAEQTLKRPVQKKYSVSIVIPARNEEGNISKIMPSIPKFGKWQEIIFVEGYSADDTWKKIKELEIKYKNVRTLKQKGKGKADAVKLGFDNAKGDILIIYDADRTVGAKDLVKFYNALASKYARFANGSRLVYPMEHDAMRTLNKAGNMIFGILFSWILGSRFKDTLCGTKALFRRDYLKYRNDYKNYLKIDPFGDFALIFTAVKHKLRIVEIPVRYKERVYGSTNIKRFRNSLQLLRMTAIAFLEFKI